MIIKSFELEKLAFSNLNIHLIHGNNEGIKQDIIRNFYIKNFNFILVGKKIRFFKNLSVMFKNL